MTNHFEPRTPSLSRTRALRAAHAVAIVASLGATGCSQLHEMSRDSGTPTDQGLADQGVVDAAEPDAAIADASPDLAAPDATEPDAAVADAATDARTPDDPAYPCIFDDNIDWECCTSMGFPPGCPVVGPFVPPSMAA